MVTTIRSTTCISITKTFAIPEALFIIKIIAITVVFFGFVIATSTPKVWIDVTMVARVQSESIEAGTWTVTFNVPFVKTTETAIAVATSRTVSIALAIPKTLIFTLTLMLTINLASPSPSLSTSWIVCNGHVYCHNHCLHQDYCHCKPICYHSGHQHHVKCFWPRRILHHNRHRNEFWILHPIEIFIGLAPHPAVFAAIDWPKPRKKRTNAYEFIWTMGQWNCCIRSVDLGTYCVQWSFSFPSGLTLSFRIEYFAPKTGQI